jgi:CBS domain-containing protein
MAFNNLKRFSGCKKFCERVGKLAANMCNLSCYLLICCCKHVLDEGYMKALDLMSVDIIAATENVSAIEVATRIVLGAINGMPIISKDDGKLLGVVTTIDILRAIRSGGDLTTIIAKEIMSPGPFSVKEDTDVSDIIDIMDKKGIMMLPVVQNDGRLIGVCSRSDVLKEILNERFVTIGMKRTVTRTIGEGA